LFLAQHNCKILFSLLRNFLQITSALQAEALWSMGFTGALTVYSNCLPLTPLTTYSYIVYYFWISFATLAYCILPDSAMASITDSVILDHYHLEKNELL